MEFPAFDYVGEIEVVEIGLEQVLPDWDFDFMDAAYRAMIR